ncbi:MAG: hypothetical protein OCD00_07855 [Colwellia sp.]
MGYLYLSYFVVQLYGITHVFNKMSISFSVIFFSIVVFIIWSFAPLMGYLLAKIIVANNNLNKQTLLFYGFIIGIIEKSLFYFNFLTAKQTDIGMLIVFCLFFLVAFTPLKLNIRLK